MAVSEEESRRIAAACSSYNEKRQVMERAAQLLAHRAVGNQEHDPEAGCIAGYCRVCQVPWPCDTAKERK